MSGQRRIEVLESRVLLTLLAADAINGSNGALDAISSGSGWNSPWEVQSDDTSVPGYNVESGSLTYGSLSTSGSHAVGGKSYQTAGKRMDTSTPAYAAFVDSLDDGFGGHYEVLGKTGTDIWISVVMRKDADNTQPIYLSTTKDYISWFLNAPPVEFGYFGGASKVWSLRGANGAQSIDSAKSVTVGQNTLFVLHCQFGDASDTVSLYVNPDESTLGNAAPASADATLTISQVQFRSLPWFAGNDPAQGSLDEIRVGTTWAEVTPTGAVASGGISGIVFSDSNSNGTQNAGETGIANWIVYLDANNDGVKDAGESTATTDANGGYSFTALSDGTYHVKQVVQSGYRKTQPPQGTAGYDVVVAGANVGNNNFGNTTNIFLAGKVFDDANSNGTQDGGEAGIAGVIVKINSPAGGSTVATRTTDATGFWRVQGLAAGSGEAVITVPGGYTPTNPVDAKYTGSASSGERLGNLNFGLHLAPPAPVTQFSASQILSADVDDSLIDDLI